MGAEDDYHILEKARLLKPWLTLNPEHSLNWGFLSLGCLGRSWFLPTPSVGLLVSIFLTMASCSAWPHLSITPLCELTTTITSLLETQIFPQLKRGR